MPLLSQIKHSDSVSRTVWKISETSDFFQPYLRLTEDERAHLSRAHPSHQNQWLAARYLIRLVTGFPDKAIVVDEYGKPWYQDHSPYFSITHSQDYVAVILADDDCGLDIERVQARLLKVMPRLLSAREWELVCSTAPESERAEICTVLWSAKEALYKAYGKRQLDFRQHMPLDWDHWDTHSGSMRGRVVKDSYDRAFEVRYERIEDYYIVSCY